MNVLPPYLRLSVIIALLTQTLRPRLVFRCDRLLVPDITCFRCVDNEYILEPV